MNDNSEHSEQPQKKQPQKKQPQKKQPQKKRPQKKQQEMPEEACPSMMGRFVGGLIRFRAYFMLIGLLLAIFAFPSSQHLTMDQSIESMYAPENPRLKDYQESKLAFGGDEFVMVVWTQPGLLENQNDDDDSDEDDAITQFDQIELFAKTLSDIPGINPDSTQAISYYQFAIRFPATRQKTLDFLQGMLLGEDKETTAIILRLIPEKESQTPRTETFREIRALANAHDPPAFVVGEPVQVHDMFQYVQRDGIWLGGISTVVLLSVILILFRSVRWMLLPILVVHTSLLITKAILFLFGIPLSMVSSMLDSLVTIIAIATVMHITVVFRSFRKNDSREEAFRKTWLQLAMPIFWTCLTTSIGFASLQSSSIQPVNSFGLMMTLGTLFVLLMTILLIPGGVLLGRFSPDPLNAPWESKWEAVLGILARRVIAHPVAWLVFSTTVFIVSLFGFNWISVETDFSKNFRSQSPIVRSLDFVESHLGGAGTWEVSFDTPEELDQEFLDKVEELAEEFRSLSPVSSSPVSENSAHQTEQKAEQKTEPQALPITKVIALTDGLKFAPKFFSRTLEAKLSTIRKYQPEFVEGLYSQEKNRMRIVLRAMERQPSDEKIKLIQNVTRLAEQKFENVRCTGLFVMLAYLIKDLLNDQVISFAIAAVGIFILMAIAFRSVSIGIISLVPNIFPIVILIGALGWSGTPLNIGTAMIASVSLGLTVDSTIHYLTYFRNLRRVGHSYENAIEQTHSEVGKALLFSNIALVCGFVVLTYSYFIPLVYFGILVSIAMLGGLFGNLVLLPILVRFHFSEERVEEQPCKVKAE